MLVFCRSRRLHVYVVAAALRRLKSSCLGAVSVIFRCIEQARLCAV